MGADQPERIDPFPAGYASTSKKEAVRQDDLFLRFDRNRGYNLR